MAAENDTDSDDESDIELIEAGVQVIDAHWRGGFATLRISDSHWSSISTKDH